MPAPKTNPQDYTGRATETKARTVTKAKADETSRMTMVRAAEAEMLATEVFDPQVQEPVILDEIEDVGVGLADKSVIIRTIADIDEMTFGVGNTYTFKQGVKYRVPRALAGHLEVLGYIWSPV